MENHHTDDSNISYYYRRLNSLRIKLGVLLLFTIVLGLGAVSFRYKIPLGVTIARYILYGISIPLEIYFIIKYSQKKEANFFFDFLWLFVEIYFIIKYGQKSFEAKIEQRERYDTLFATLIENYLPTLPYSVGFIIVLVVNILISSNAQLFELFAFFAVIAVFLTSIYLYYLRKELKEMLEFTLI